MFLDVFFKNFACFFDIYMTENDRILAGKFYFDRRFCIAVAHAACLGYDRLDSLFVEFFKVEIHNFFRAACDSACSHSDFDLDKGIDIVSVLSERNGVFEFRAHFFEISE